MSRSKRISNVVTKAFADRLDDLVNEKKQSGMSQKQIAAAIGIASGSLSEWCSDSKTPTMDQLPKIAAYFGVSVDYLLGLTPIKSANIEKKAICEALKINEESVDFILASNENVKVFLNDFIRSFAHCRTELGETAYSVLDHFAESILAVPKLVAISGENGYEEYIKVRNEAYHHGLLALFPDQAAKYHLTVLFDVIKQDIVQRRIPSEKEDTTNGND